MPITDFFGSVRRVEVSDNFVNVSGSEGISEVTSNRNKLGKGKLQFVDQLPIDTLVQSK